ncbi:hypothetical protein [Pseudomaricurvus sp.]|uniref:hypothetical protein n=1 Tax=Pseudomaricurvus sp. TaxID=2004510 RepID=UPI003F6BD58C
MLYLLGQVQAQERVQENDEWVILKSLLVPTGSKTSIARMKGLWQKLELQNPHQND